VDSFATPVPAGTGVVQDLIRSVPASDNTIPTGESSTNLSQTHWQREGQAHFAPNTSQNEPVPDSFGIGTKKQPIDVNVVYPSDATLGDSRESQPEEVTTEEIIQTPSETTRPLATLGRGNEINQPNPNTPSRVSPNTNDRPILTVAERNYETRNELRDLEDTPQREMDKIPPRTLSQRYPVKVAVPTQHVDTDHRSNTPHESQETHTPVTETNVATVADVAPIGNLPGTTNKVETIGQRHDQAELDFRVTDQISNSMIAHASLNSEVAETRFRMRLEPPELGEVMVQLTESAEGVKAEIVVSREATLEIMERSLASLRQSLDNAGVTVREFDVSYQSNQSQHSSDWAQPRPDQHPVRDRNAGTAAAPITNHTRLQHGGGDTAIDVLA
jgi:hypothetical protein